MRNVLVTLISFVLLAWAGLAFGAPNTTHGQSCDSDITKVLRGRYRAIGCVNLCNNYAAADDGAACTEYEFKGVPDLIVLEREDNDAGCAGDVTFTFTTGPVTGGTPSYGLDATTVVLNDATDRLIFVMKDFSMDAFLFTAVATDTSCTDVDVRMYLISYED